MKTHVQHARQATYVAGSCAKQNWGSRVKLLGISQQQEQRIKAGPPEHGSRVTARATPMKPVLLACYHTVNLEF